MPRLYEIEVACRAAIVTEPNGRRLLTTRRFLQELEKVNWHWSPRQANLWIESYVTTFRDVSTQEGDDRTFQLYNPNGGL
ncbi:DNA polymerase V [Raoultella ornithinolytica]|uniref:DNA polymerase V n=1 Tax=Raoultella ornithinolytica TaxID=54291 RepID=UPI000F4D2431|nr:DNA polymerase V [Raoultella ornithinolytica]AYW54135.1 DNA polymerase V [Raoultella ornithinolytica]QYE31827.1 DNA polymerase V [Raoultella ornithinolytica]